MTRKYSRKRQYGMEETKSEKDKTMLGIYAETFKTATLTGCTTLHDVPSVPDHKRLNWFSRRPKVCVDLSKL